MSLSKLKEICEKATEGEWKIFVIASSAGTSYRIYSEFPPADRDIAHIPKEWLGENNAAFIAAARTAMPLLLKVAEKFEAFSKTCDNYERDEYAPDRAARVMGSGDKFREVCNALRALEGK